MLFLIGMATRIEIRSNVFDTRAVVLKKKLAVGSLEKKISDISLTDVYTVDKDFSSTDLKRIGEMLAHPVTQQFSINVPLSPQKFTYAFEIGFLPGVTDNIATTTREMIEELLKVKFEDRENVYTS